MEQPSNTPAGRRAVGPRGARDALWLALRALLWLVALILAGGVLVALMSHLQASPDDLARWQHGASQVKRWGLVLQVGLLALAVARWDALVDWARRRDIVKAHELERVRALRWSAALVGLAYLILVPIGPTTLWRLLMG